MNIQVNLFPYREEHKKQTVKRLGIACGGFAGIILGVCILGYVGFSVEQESQKAKNSYLEEQAKLLDEKIKDIEGLKEQTKALVDRKRVVEKLQTNRAHGVLLLNELMKIIPPGISLRSVSEKGDDLTFQGLSNSNANISLLMKNIEDSDFLNKSVLVGIQAVSINGQRFSDFTVKASVREPKPDDRKNSAQAAPASPAQDKKGDNK